MCCPSHFQEDRPSELLRLIVQFPLATIVHHGADGLTADHVPLLFQATLDGAGKLVGHVAKHSPLWQVPPDQEPLVVFQGPSTYISPNWYATKHEAGKVVPAWNYAVVHAHCSLRAIHDPEQVRQLVTQLTDQHEVSQAHPWRVADAPTDYTDRLLANIVGIELHVHRMQGKWKVSQNQPQQNQQSVVQGLLSEGGDSLAAMASLVRARTTL